METYPNGSHRYVLTLVDQKHGKELSYSCPDVDMLFEKGMAKTDSPIRVMAKKIKELDGQTSSHPTE